MVNVKKEIPTVPVFLTSREHTANIIFTWFCKLYRSGKLKINIKEEDIAAAE